MRSLATTSLKEKWTIYSKLLLQPGFFRQPLLIALLLLLFLAGVSGCQQKTTKKPKEPSTPNLFENPGFEQGKKPWFSLTTPGWGPPFEVTSTLARSGKKSAYLKMRSEVSGTQVFGAVQEISPEKLPEVVSGYYRIENWQKGIPLQYFQFVVIAKKTDLPGGHANHQIRYILGGIKDKPFELENAKFVFVGPETPELKKWVRFERNLAEDFKAQWGAIPKKFSSIRVFLEARYEQKTPEQPEAIADVYFDDLYIGP